MAWLLTARLLVALPLAVLPLRAPYLAVRPQIARAVKQPVNEKVLCEAIQLVTAQTGQQAIAQTAANQVAAVVRLRALAQALTCMQAPNHVLMWAVGSCPSAAGAARMVDGPTTHPRLPRAAAAAALESVPVGVELAAVGSIRQVLPRPTALLPQSQFRP